MLGVPFFRSFQDILDVKCFIFRFVVHCVEPSDSEQQLIDFWVFLRIQSCFENWLKNILYHFLEAVNSAIGNFFVKFV